MTNNFRRFLKISLASIAAIIVFQLGYIYGASHSHAQARLEEVVRCLSEMNKLAITLTGEKLL